MSGAKLKRTSVENGILLHNQNKCCASTINLFRAVDEARNKGSCARARAVVQVAASLKFDVSGDLAFGRRYLRIDCINITK